MPGRKPGQGGFGGEPALQAWAAEYRAAGQPAEPASSPARAWLIGGAAAAVVAGLAAWLLIAVRYLSQRLAARITASVRAATR